MEITLLQFLLGLLLVIVPGYILYHFGSHLLAKAMRAWVKMLVILTVFGAILYEVLALNNVLVTLSFAILMVLSGALLTVSKAKLRLSQMLIPVFTGMMGATLVIGFYFLALVVGFKHMLEARYLIPVMGLLMGHLIMVNGNALHLYAVGLKHHGELYHYLLGNGATQMEALNYLMRRAIERAALPSLSNMGLIVVGVSPVVLWSMLISGVGVVEAVAFQILILMAFLCASVVSVTITLVVSRRFLIDDYSQLKVEQKDEPEEE